MADKLDLTQTRAALIKYNAMQGELEQMLKTMSGNDSFYEWDKRRQAAEDLVKEAFHRDTKHVNSLDNCMLIGIYSLQEMVAKEDAA